MKAFTLLELLVVISIVCVLIGVFLPPLSRARERGRDVVCTNNIKQLYTATMGYVRDYKDFFYYPDNYPNIPIYRLTEYYYSSLSPYLDAEPPSLNRQTTPWTCKSDKNQWTFGGTSYLYYPTIVKYDAILRNRPTYPVILFEHNPSLFVWSEHQDFHNKGRKNCINMSGSLFSRIMP